MTAGSWHDSLQISDEEEVWEGVYLATQGLTSFPPTCTCLVWVALVVLLLGELWVGGDSGSSPYVSVTAACGEPLGVSSCCSAPSIRLSRCTPLSPLSNVFFSDSVTFPKLANCFAFGAAWKGNVKTTWIKPPKMGQVCRHKLAYTQDPKGAWMSACLLVTLSPMYPHACVVTHNPPVLLSPQVQNALHLQNILCALHSLMYTHKWGTNCP